MGQNYGSSSKLVIVGSVGAPFGVHGWLKINSYTEPKDNILRFKKWFLVEEQQGTIKQPSSDPVSILEIKESQDKFLVLFSGILDRSKAAILTNKKIAIEREDLPELSKDEYYWADLIGSKVYNLSEKLLGVLDHMFATLANDVMVIKPINTIPSQGEGEYIIANNVEQEYLIPYKIGEFVISVDLPNKTIIVNWDV